MRTILLLSLLGAVACARQPVTEGRYDLTITELVTDCPASARLDEPMQWDVHEAAGDTFDLSVHPHEVALSGGAGRDGVVAFGEGAVAGLPGDATWSVELLQEAGALEAHVDLTIIPISSEVCSARFAANGPRER